MSLADPAAVEARLDEIEQELAVTQNALEDAAMAWFRARREREREAAIAFIRAEGTAGERKARADLAVADLEVDGEPVWELEGKYETLRSKVRVLGDRAAIGMSVLKAQGRA